MQATVLWNTPIQFRENPRRINLEVIETATPGIVLHPDLLVDLEKCEKTTDWDGSEKIAKIHEIPLLGNKWTLCHLSSGMALIAAVKTKKAALILAARLGKIADFTQNKDALLKTPGILNEFFRIRDEVLG